MNHKAGFTLIELMVVVAIVAIIAAFALPAYTDYVLRGKVQEAFTNLSALRVTLEQYYQDNRFYNVSGTPGTCGIPAGTPSTSFTGFNGATTPTVGAKYFTYTCTTSNTVGVGDQAYSITATGTAEAKGLSYAIDNTNTKTTTSVGTSGWNPPSSNCWLRRKDGSC